MPHAKDLGDPNLDEALQETFPASDPISPAEPAADDALLARPDIWPELPYDALAPTAETLRSSSHGRA